VTFQLTAEILVGALFENSGLIDYTMAQLAELKLLQSIHAYQIRNFSIEKE